MKICNVCHISQPFNNFHKHKLKKDGTYTICKTCRKISTKIYYAKNKHSIKIKTLNYYKLHRTKRIGQFLQYQKRKVKTDILFKLKRNLRNRLWYSLKNTHWNKNNTFKSYIGLENQNQLIQYLESKFDIHMNWDNYGNYWEIDHIIPLASAKTEEELYKLCHYTNLQPLEKSENRAKKDSQK